MEKRQFNETLKEIKSKGNFIATVIKQTLQGLFIYLFLSSCHDREREVQEVLEHVTIQQKNQIMTFMEYYTNDKKKLEVSKYIVANLLNKHSITGKNSMIYQVYVDSIDNNWQSINSPKNHNYRQETKQFTPDHSFIKTRDIDILQIDSLIQQTNLAFKTWEQSSWSSQYPSEIFEEYIVPHRIADEPLEYYWRSDAYTRYKNLVQEYNDSSLVATCSHIYQHLDFQTNNLFWGEPLQSYSINSKYRRGTCSDYAVYTTMVMRALGIPTAIDFVPYWGDGNNGHTFNSLILPDNTCKGYNNKEDLTRGLTLSGKVPKIYRKVYNIQRKSPLYKHRNTEFIPEVFAQHDIIDVTHYYDIPTTNITIIPNLLIPQSKLVYLAVFSPQKWHPVAWAEYKKGKADFKSIGVGYTDNDSPSIKGENYGEGCLFIPVSYQHEEMQPLDYPFILTEKRVPRYLIPDMSNTETITLYRKFPRKKRILDFASKLKGGYFELSNDYNFSNSEIVYYLDSIPASYIQTIPLSKKKFRYLRFYKRSGGFSIGELGCLNKENRILPSKIIADPVLIKDTELKNICDSNILSYLDISDLRNIWVGLDFAYPVELSTLFFCPRTDDNDISPDNEYELFYWGNKWISLGKQIANSHKIEYKNVPKNALLWLRNLTKGKEERPFTYDNGKQIWW